MQNNNDTDVLRQKCISNPPEGLTPDDIKQMSEDDLLNMDFFLNEDDGPFFKPFLIWASLRSL